MIDGYAVNIGDTVYILGIGTGRVVCVNADGGFTVKHGSGETFFRDGGYIGNQRRVYWHDPLIVLPPKDLRFWRAYTDLAKQLYTACENFGKLNDDEQA